MRLYISKLSSNARRAAMAAAHLRCPLELIDIDLMSEADRRRLGQLNPNCKVPVLEDDGFLLWESCAIMQYLAERTPGQTVYPREVRQRAEVNRWMFWACQHFSPAIGVLTWERIWKGRVTGGAPDPAEVARGEGELAQFAAVLDGHLAGRRWLVGEAPTLADFALAPALMYTGQARLPVAQYPHLQAWYARVQTLEAWKETSAAGCTCLLCETAHRARLRLAL